VSAPATAAPVAAAPRPAGRGAVGLALLALFVALLTLAALAAPLWLLHQGEDPLALIGLTLPSPRLDAAEGRIADLEGELRRAERDAEGAVQAAEALGAQLLSLREGFTTLSADLAADSPLDQRQWRIAEAAYLLRVADLRARMEGDRDGSQALLEAADLLLLELDDPGLYPVREAIAAALANLRAQPVFDRVGIYLELEQLSDRVGALPLELPEFERAQPSPDSAAGTIAWLQATLTGLFDFRVHRPDPVRPLMAPDEAVYLRHNLQLKLEQAQLALLRGDQPVWRSTLEEALGWVQTYFDPRDPEAAALALALARISEERIDVAAPDVSAPLVTLLRLRGRGEARADP
jgi:uroporphyrin-3 C-methyltransferase